MKSLTKEKRYDIIDAIMIQFLQKYMINGMILILTC